MSRSVRLWAPVVVYMAVLFFLSSRSDLPGPEGVSDKAEHAAAYFVLGVLVVRWLAGGLPPRMSWGVAIASLAITIAYGASDEFHQSFVPGRTADVLDLRADAAGAAIATVACGAWGIILQLSRARDDL